VAPRTRAPEATMLRLFMIAVLVLSASACLAATETQTFSVSNGGLTDFYATLDIPQHDSDLLGELLQVTLDFEAVIDGYFYYENLGGGTGGYQINENTWTFTATVLGDTPVNASNTMTHPLTLVDPFDGVEDYAGASGATVPYVDSAAGSAVWLPADAGFSSFEGAATVPVDVATTIWTSYTTYGSPSRSGLHTDTTWTVTVTYEYDPASVPAEGESWGRLKALYR
jgi:hypothetical protein